VIGQVPPLLRDTNGSTALLQAAAPHMRRLVSESAHALITRPLYDCSVSASVPASMAVPATAKQQNENDNDENRGHIHM
jgi:hypothetical protein